MLVVAKFMRASLLVIMTTPDLYSKLIDTNNESSSISQAAGNVSAKQDTRYRQLLPVPDP